MNSQIGLFITHVDYRRKDPVFWIDFTTNLIKYKQKRRRVPRYYSELEKLHDHLCLTLDDVLIPPLPMCPKPRLDKEGQVIGRQWWYTIRLPNEEKKQQTDHVDDAVEQRIQKWLNRVAEHERVSWSITSFKASSMHDNLLMRPQFRPSLNKAALYKSKTKHIVIHTSEEDMEPEFGSCSRQLSTFGQHLHHLSVHLDRLVQHQTGFARCWAGLSNAWVSYGGTERNPNLFILYKSIAKGCYQVFEIERSEALAANDTLGDELVYQEKNCKSAQNAMQRRLNACSAYISSKRHTESSLRSVERLKSSINIDRDQASEAIATLEEARFKEKENLQKFQRIDENLRHDVEHNYKKQTTQDLLKTIKEYAKSQLFLERKKLAIFEEVIHSHLGTST
ncbi:Vacuolar protein sorting-associated protein 17 [Choanephora cucurbitarum]|uniref:Vacuolar protein sorting-associated protein 17 n=1 Tax=Choanephora cucurbitarum TaxID=101091 RepID=A0A1C7NJM8_9FUNG|nr:Vacuolar protein sorting-associated protein 17 [Choanephora cucurbitarum]